MEITTAEEWIAQVQATLDAIKACVAANGVLATDVIRLRGQCEGLRRENSKLIAENKFPPVVLQSLPAAAMDKLKADLAEMTQQRDRLTAKLAVAERKCRELESDLEIAKAWKEPCWIPISTPPTEADGPGVGTLNMNHPALPMSVGKWDDLDTDITHWCRMPARPEDKKELVTQWRILNVGDMRIKGDEYYDPYSGEWKPCPFYAEIPKGDYPVRRKIQ